MLTAYSICQPSESYAIAGSVNSKSVFETFRRRVPPRFASDEPAFWGALALAAPAKLDATSKQAPITAMAIESVSFLCIGLLPLLGPPTMRRRAQDCNHRGLRRTCFAFS